MSLQGSVLSYVATHLLFIVSYKQKEAFVNSKQAILLKPGDEQVSVVNDTT